MSQRSPFPGMDPWLEAHWGDVHHSLIHYARSQLQPHLPANLYATVEENVSIAGPTSERSYVRPDVAAFETRSPNQGVTPITQSASGVALAEPLRIRVFPQPLLEGHIEIRQLGGEDKLITAIEVISRTNKLDRRNRDAYESKRKAYYSAGVNVVEIDLVRAGEPLLDIPFDYLKDGERTPYTACAYRAPIAGSAWVAEYYSLPLRQRLSAIRVPLRPEDADAVLDLQALIDGTYQEGRYAARIDYSKPPKPPLSQDDSAWAATQVNAWAHPHESGASPSAPHPA